MIGLKPMLSRMLLIKGKGMKIKKEEQLEKIE